MTMTEQLAEVELARAGELLSRIGEVFDSRVVGQARLRTAMLVTMLAEGHLLVESVPGLAKTLASSTLAQAVNARFSRIQCTPDLLPSDIIGTQVYDPGVEDLTDLREEVPRLRQLDLGQLLGHRHRRILPS